MKQDLEKMMQEAPTLTLEPFAEEKPAETVKQEEVKKADEKENLRAILSPGEQEQVEAFVKQIDVTNSQLVLQYGASAQKKIADFSEAQRRLKEKLVEALQAVVPIMAIVVALCFCIAPVSPSILLCFLLGGGDAYRRDDVFYAGSGACDDADGGKGRIENHEVEKTVAYRAGHVSDNCSAENAVSDGALASSCIVILILKTLHEKKQSVRRF